MMRADFPAPVLSHRIRQQYPSVFDTQKLLVKRVWRRLLDGLVQRNTSLAETAQMVQS
jgi:hypothetical protein